MVVFTSATRAAKHTEDNILIYGFDGTENRKIKTDPAGEPQVDVLSTPTDAVVGSPPPAKATYVAGFDGALVKPIKTDAAGEVQADILSQPPRVHTVDSFLAYGFDGTANRKIKTDAAGEIQADVLSAPPAVHTTDSISIWGHDGTDFRRIKTDGTGAVDIADRTARELGRLTGLTNIQHVETTTPLAAGATFTGPSRDCLHFANFTVSCFADQPGTLHIENSRDGTVWRTHDTISITAGVPVNRVYSVTMRFNRVRYVNGPTPQGVFELVTMLKVLG